MTVTCIREAGWVACWNPIAAQHEYRTNVDVVFDDDKIIWIDPDYIGPVDHELNGRDRFVMPGLINVHCHPSGEPLKKGFREEFGNPQMHMSPLYDRAFMLQTDDAGSCVALQYGVAEMLKSGVTSIVDLSFPYEGWLDTMAATGIRAWMVPSFASSSWSTRDGHSVDYNWDETRGRLLLNGAIQVARDAENHDCGRLSAMLGPAQIDTCTEDLLRTSLDAARDNGWKLHTHAAQSLVEFYEMTRRHGTTPVQWANDIGLLGPDSILAHAIFIDEHSFTHWPGRNDRALLADTGTGVAHCPGVFARNGQALEDLGSYLQQGVLLGIGTDSFPHNMIEEMRMAAILARVVTGDVAAGSTSAVFHAATIGGADLVDRPDLGRLAVGATADVVLVDLSHTAMMPIRDPLRSLVYTAADRAVNDVFVGGKQVLADGVVTTIDVDEISAHLQEIRDQAERNSSQYHYAGRSAVEVAPLSLPISS